MIRKIIFIILNKIFKESSASNISKSKDLIIGSSSYDDIKSGIDDLYNDMFDDEYRSKKFEKSIKSYKESINKFNT